MEKNKKYQVEIFDGEYGIVRITNDGKPEQTEFDTLEEAIKCCKRFWKNLGEEMKKDFLTNPRAYVEVIELENGRAKTVFDMLSSTC